MKKIYNIMLIFLATQSLLYGAADINDSNIQLMIAIKQDNIQKAREAILNGAQLDGLGKNHPSPLDYAITQNKPSMVALLLEKGANPNGTVDTQSLTPLNKAIDLRNRYIIKLLINHGADINAASFHYETPLHQAILKEDTDIVTSLINSGANVNGVNTEKTTPLLLAAFTNNTNMVKLLLDKGANHNIDMSLYYAVRNRNIDIARLLLDHGADVNTSDIHGNTPLHIAVANNSADMVKLLLEYSPNDSIRNKRGQTALNIARERGYQNIVELLNQYEAPPTVKEVEL